MKIPKKEYISILFKYEAIVLGLLIVFFLFFLKYSQNMQYTLLKIIYQKRKTYIIQESKKNIKENIDTRLHLISSAVQKHKRELSRALFLVDEKKCKEIISYLSAFPSIKAIVLDDMLIGKNFLTAVKTDDNHILFNAQTKFSPSLQILKVKLENNLAKKKIIGLLKIYYDQSLFQKDAKKLEEEELKALEKEFLIAKKMLENNLKKQILSLFLIFSIFYIALHISFIKIINQPIKKLEHNLHDLFNILTNQDDAFTLEEIKTKDEFGRMERFINDGIKKTIKIHEELERHAREISKLATVLEQSVQPIVITDVKGNIEYVNKAFEKTTGYSFKEVKGKNPKILKSGQHPKEFYKHLWESITSGKSWQGIFTNKKKDGTIFYERAVIFPVKKKNGEITNYAAVKQDITKEKILEQQLLQAQKMESIGTLAGGIAHDFNNILTVINGYAELTLIRMPESNPLRCYISSIMEATKKAQSLTSQLLAFSRKQVYNPEVLDINKVITSMEKMIRRLINEDIIIETHLSDDLPKIKADVAQLEQIFVNLIINARDALNARNNLNEPKKITIRTGQYYPDTEKVFHDTTNKANRYVWFEVSDNGIGMDPQTKQKIFEPFFTTKKKHRGTGLGLSIVYGIVKQNKGIIHVFSEPEKGCTFKIYWPVVDNHLSTIQNKSTTEKKLFNGNETILLVEDEDDVRRFAKEALISLGYTVYAAENGQEALSILKKGVDIDLIITDLIMPEMDGQTLALKAKNYKPTLKVIYVSGYMDEHINYKKISKNLLPKPYSVKKLSSFIRKILDGKQ